MRFRPDCTQMIWDWSFEYFANSPERCFTPGQGCRYIRFDGHRCVVGSMFETQNPNDDRFLLNYFGPVRELVPILEEYVPSLGWLQRTDIALLTEIQVVHDMTDSWDQHGFTVQGVKDMFNIANSYHLSTDYSKRFNL